MRIIYGKFDYDFIAPNITSGRNIRLILPFESGEEKIEISCLRLQCFKRSTVCVNCGREGTVFFVEKSNQKDKSPHLNLYCVEGDEYILMTHDHILPLSKGGDDDINNVQTMCSECNWNKDNRIDDINLIEGLKDLISHLIQSGMRDRDIFNYIMNANMKQRIGFTPDGGDFVSIIRQLLTEKEK